MQQDKVKNGKDKHTVEASYVDGEAHNDVNVVAQNKDNVGNEWILDFGYFYYMCPFKDLFSTYDSVVGGTDLVCYNEPCKVIILGLSSLNGCCSDKDFVLGSSCS